ncbi:DUF3280 domain-containing protein [Methylocystis heyeri]|uniref:DUF2380 domain-containing protein n=1 Tax=Methylocystis heyeri TaxID=391905 RepID=A0A6B8KH61_9HYPH|nr:DUF3280 domain-containing protein [Methylocystis heyeri]QGM45898.1 DUF2380 domain-containing protein [Methylocystis heyeri]
MKTPTARLAQNLLLSVLLLFAAPAGAAEKLKVAFFGFEMFNTSPLPTSAEERARIARIEEVFREMLSASGRYEVVAIPEELQRKIAQSSKITGCNGCQLDWAMEAGAEIAAFGVVQKVSNLILNENLYMDRVDGSAFFSRSVDIRGNTDESWERGMRYLIGNYLLKEK